ncbi:PIG-L family deacetylase [Coraliomargarita algicola]|uniref:PIG-L family deacetylase n=1 Tax=Coraliomargarita algicola TaxID=3092156 RepID=A0ABZ0RI39_9BACT|nr:PIG-L family deacetylase [Coraliomargarita sp. J2-16]WPJ95865.1 PIG-L family deacetylase [Coraliomargarita sp. J2-16]
MIALAIVAHPDDIEFMLAGTLLQLKSRGVEIHMMNLADGSLGSSTLSPEECVRGRWEESQASASVMGAMMHPPLFPDLEVYYNQESLAKVIAAVRRVKPDIVLTQALADYMEDHQNSARLAVTAAISRSMKNAKCDPFVEPYDKPVAVYHAMPHGLQDPFGRTVTPERFIDISDVIATKTAMLNCHKSQAQWLEDTQGMSVLETEMTEMATAMGQRSGAFSLAEGLIRHNPLGFGPSDFDPIAELLGSSCLKNSNFHKND